MINTSYVLGVPELQPVSFIFGSELEAQGFLKQDWGRIAANFLRDQWICLDFLIGSVGIPESVEISQVSKTLAAALSCSVEALALLPSDLVLPVLNFMKMVLPQVSFSKARLRYGHIHVNTFLRIVHLCSHDLLPAF